MCGILLNLGLFGKRYVFRYPRFSKHIHEIFLEKESPSFVPTQAFSRSWCFSLGDIINDLAKVGASKDFRFVPVGGGSYWLTVGTKSS
jgi:hypothetical protein